MDQWYIDGVEYTEEEYKIQIYLIKNGLKNYE